MAQADYPAAFVRYLRQEVRDLALPIEKALADQGERVIGGEVIASVLLAIASYLVRSIGSMSRPEAHFWGAVVDFFSDEIGTERIGKSRSRDYFTKGSNRRTSAGTSEFGTSELQVIDALRSYDEQRGSDFAERLRMFFWRFASAFIASDDEVDVHGEEALAEVKQLLGGETMSVVGELKSGNIGLFKQLQRTIAEIKDPLHTMMRMGWQEGEEVPPGDRLLVQSLNRILIHFGVGLVEVYKVQ